MYRDHGNVALLSEPKHVNGSVLVKNLREISNHMLGNCERKDKLGSDNQQLGSKPLEKCAKALILDEIRNDRHSSFRRVKRTVLYARFDNI